MSLLLAEDLTVYPSPRLSPAEGLPHPHEPVYRALTFDLAAGGRLALFDEDESAGLHLALALVGMGGRIEGRCSFLDHELKPASRARWAERRRQIQLLFPDEFGALDTRLTIGESVGESSRCHRPSLSPTEHELLLIRSLEASGLRPSVADKRPEDLAPLERQLASLAKAMVSRPRLLLAIAPTRGLEPKEGARLLERLGNAHRTHDFGLVITGGDLAAARRLSEDLLVLRSGRCVEQGPTSKLLQAPGKGYTKRLVEAGLRS